MEIKTLFDFIQPKIKIDNKFTEFKKIQYMGNKLLVKVETDTGRSILCTEDHEFMTESSGLCEAHLLNLDEYVHTVDGLEKIKSVTRQKSGDVYDVINASGKLFNANGFIVHNCFMADEMAFVEDSEKFMRAVRPMMASGKNTKIVLTTTPNGKQGFFYKQWVKALKGLNNYFTMGVPWYLVPGRDENWKKQEIEDSDLLSFRQEMNIEFIANATSLIDPFVLEQIELSEKPEIIEKAGSSNIYKSPEPNGVYVMTVDTAEGKQGDFSTFTIFRVDTPQYEPVVTYHDNSVAPVVYAGIIKRWAELYNDALVVVENNSVSGSLTAYNLYMIDEYENVYCQHTLNETGIGVRVSQKVKSIGCTTLAAMAKKQKVLFWDTDTIEELVNFEAKGSSYEGSMGVNDDRVQNYWLFAWFTQQEQFKDLYIESNDDEIKEHIDDLYSDELEEIRNMPILGQQNQHNDLNQDVNTPVVNSTYDFW